MEQHFQQVNVDLQRVHVYFRQLEHCQNEGDAQPIFQTLSQEMKKISDGLITLDKLVGKEPASRRRASRYRLDQLQYDYNSVNSAVSHLQNQLTSRWRTAAEREELLTRRFTANETQLDMEGAELQVNDRLRESHNHIDQMLAQGTAVLDSLRAQHMSIRGFKRKLLDIGQTLGLSTTTLRMIEKRLEEDWLIFLVLCVLSLIFMYAFYRYWTS